MSPEKLNSAAYTGFKSRNELVWLFSFQSVLLVVELKLLLFR